MFRALVRARARERVPVAQLTGQREFWSLPLRVTRRRADPAPRHRDARRGRARSAARTRRRPRACSTSAPGAARWRSRSPSERPRAAIFASDCSREALKVAQQNAEALGMAARIHFLRGDWTAPLAGGFDCVVANPPYLAEAERAALAPELAHEPAAALFAGPTGLEALERLCREVPALLVARAAGSRSSSRRARRRRCRRGSRRPASPPRCTAISRAARAWFRAGTLRSGVGDGSDRRARPRGAARRSRGVGLEELDARADGGRAARARRDAARERAAAARRLGDARDPARARRARGVGSRRRSRGADRREHDPQPRGALRPRAQDARVVPRARVRCSRASAPRACRSPAAARSACGRSIST